MRCQNQVVHTHTHTHTQQSSILTETKFLPPKYTIGTVFNAYVDYLFPSRNLRVCIAFVHAEIHTGSQALRNGKAYDEMEQSVWYGIRYEKRIANNNSLLISYYRSDALTPRPIIVTWDTSSRFGERHNMTVVRMETVRSFLRNEQEI